MKSVDTIIIGGGLSGLYTAMQIQGKKESFLLFEAKSEPGGRILGKPTVQNPNLAIDLGPTWFWPHQTKMKSLIKRLELESFEQYATGDAMYQNSRADKPSRTVGGGMMHSLRVKGGMHSIIRALLQRIDLGFIKTDHVVSNVEFIKNTWCIKVLHNGIEQHYECKNLVMAVPPRIINKYFAPEKYLSEPLVETLKAQQTWMSGQAKFVAVYNSPFWREEGLSGQAMSRVGPMVEIHDASSAANDGAALFGFLGIPASSRRQLNPKDLQASCLNQLTAIFGKKAANPDSVYLKDWANDKFTATGQDINEPPRHAAFFYKRYAQELRQLNLHLVATEFAQFEAGYLEGALLAADNALTLLNTKIWRLNQNLYRLRLSNYSFYLEPLGLRPCPMVSIP